VVNKVARRAVNKVARRGASRAVKAARAEPAKLFPLSILL
jgi:hypothetical protein